MLTVVFEENVVKNKRIVRALYHCKDRLNKCMGFHYNDKRPVNHLIMGVSRPVKWHIFIAMAQGLSITNVVYKNYTTQHWLQLNYRKLQRIAYDSTMKLIIKYIYTPTCMLWSKLGFRTRVPAYPCTSMTLKMLLRQSMCNHLQMIRLHVWLILIGILRCIVYYPSIY